MLILTIYTTYFIICVKFKNYFIVIFKIYYHKFKIKAKVEITRALKNLTEGYKLFKQTEFKSYSFPHILLIQRY